MAGGSRVLLHVPPVWPPRPGTEQMQVHLDLEVDDLDAACALAEEAGARRLGGYDSPEEVVRVYADPAGHPFCLFVHVGNGSPGGADPA